MVYGWAGKILYIDLTKGKIVEKPSDEYVRAFLGGRGVNTKLLYDLSKPGQTAFDPENPIIFGAGGLAGTGLIGTGKMEVTSRSPAQTEWNLLGNVGMGGHWSAELKFAGYDNVAIIGRASKPTYIYIENDNVQLKDAKNVWGKGVFDTVDLMREELDDPDVQIANIGPAGENLVVQATIEHSYRSGSPMGAVMGAKNLKAVAVRGTTPVPVYDPEKILEYNQKMIEVLKVNKPISEKMREVMQEKYYKKAGFGKGGDASGMGFLRAQSGVVGDYESHLWRYRKDVDEAIYESRVAKDTPYYVKNIGCFGCPFPCQPLYDVPDIGAAVFRCYPTFWHWKIWLSDMKAAYEAYRLGSDYGLELWQVVTAISWLMHLYHDGKISAKDTDGVAFERGSKEALMQTIDKVVFRKGFGDILANGPVALAKKLGPDAEKYLVHKKGFMPRTFDFRTEPGTALGEAVSARGNSLRATTYGMVMWGAMETPEQLKAGYDYARKLFGTEKALIASEYEGKPKALIYNMNGQALSLSLGFCKGAGGDNLTPSFRKLDPSTMGMEAGMHREIVTLDFAAARITAATGMPIDAKILYKMAERIITTERAFNVRDGVTRKDDILHDFFFTTPVIEGPQKGKILDRKKFEKMKDEYYQLRGWDVATGVPSRKRLEELGLKDIADSLEKLGKLPKPQKA